ncbi:MAG: PilZ domain-containing protein [Myxococcota bacterium]|nr:PilZ domain-containing protein [Myxococcota bacterium]
MQQDRIDTSLPARFVAGPLRAQGRVKNVGRGGLFVGTASIPEQGDSVTLVFEAPDGARIRARGLVWWTTLDSPGESAAQGFGVRLLEADSSYQSLVERLAS